MAAPQVPINNVVNVTVEQKSSSSGWIAATMVLLFATPLGCIAIPVALLILVFAFSIALALLPMIIGVSAAVFVWNSKVIAQDKKLPIVGGIIGVAVLAQLTLFLVSAQNQEPSKPATPATQTPVKP